MRILSKGRLISLVLLCSVSLLSAGCFFDKLEPATLSLIDDAEAVWLASPAPSYRMTVEIDRPGDRRRSIVTVVDHEIVEGVVSYWDFEDSKWQEPYALNEEQSFPFSVPGLFDMVRGALEESGRQSIHVMMAGEPPFPQRIILGPVVVDGEPFDQTKATVTIHQFDRQ